MITRRHFCLALASSALLSRELICGQTEEVLVPYTFRLGDQTMPYRLFSPTHPDRNRRAPLVLWLCGSAGRGSNNLNQISFGNVIGSHVWTTPENQAKHPCFVVAPQCPDNDSWASDEMKPTRSLLLALELLRDLQKRFAVDSRRLYVAGQSMGGFGTWAAISVYPETFAAAIPLCGGGDEKQAARLKDIPIWAFHGAKDEAVNVERSRRMIAAVRQAGGQPRYTEYPDEGHTIWEKVFREPELLPWVFAQKKK
jgi:predicted peptidase